MRNGNELAFNNPGRPELVLRRANLPNMSPQVRPNSLPQAAGSLAQDIGAGNYGSVLDTLVDYGATSVGLPRGVGAAASRTVRAAASGFTRGRAQRAQTATNATRGNGQTTPPAGTGTRRPSRERRDEDKRSRGGGGNAIVIGDNTPNMIMPVIKGHLSTIEGGPLPVDVQKEDYVSQLHVANYSLATWWLETNPLSTSPMLYDPNSIKSKQISLIFGRLLNDLFKEVTTKFTDDFTDVNFRKYMHTFIQSLELITHVESVLSYNSKVGYADKFIANEYYQEVYSDYLVIDALKRLKTVLKNKNFPPKLTGLIHTIFQLYKMQNIEQSVNFRFIPLLGVLIDESNYSAEGVLNASAIRSRIIAAAEHYISILTQRDMTLVSKAIGFIRPNYGFSVNPAPNMAAMYNQDMVELFINLPRLYSSNSISADNVYAFPQPVVGDDRPYVISREVDTANSVMFALQSQPITRSISSSNTDYTNFGSTFSSIVGVSSTSHRSNVFSMVSKSINSIPCPVFEPEGILESIVSGRSYVVDFGNGLSAAPTNKYSLTPSTCQRVYFNNTFAPIDAVRKLVDDVLDMN